MLLLALSSLSLIVVLSLYFLWLQAKTLRDHTKALRERDQDLLDRLMFTTGNQGYIRETRQAIEPPKAEDEPVDEGWREI
jgi:hypothetical protein